MRVDFTFHGQLCNVEVPDSQVQDYAINSLHLSAASAPGWEMRQAKLKHSVDAQGNDCHEVRLDGRPVATLSEDDLRNYATSQLGMVKPGPAERQTLAREAQGQTGARLKQRRERFEAMLSQHARSHGLEAGAARFSFLQTEEGQAEWERVREAELDDSRAQSKAALAAIAV